MKVLGEGSAYELVGSRTGAPAEEEPRNVSSPRHIERSVRSYRTALSCAVHIKGYETRWARSAIRRSERT
jgi:Ni,Fe-hydrogenase I large subunit